MSWAARLLVLASHLAELLVDNIFDLLACQTPGSHHQNVTCLGMLSHRKSLRGAVPSAASNPKTQFENSILICWLNGLKIPSAMVIDRPGELLDCNALREVCAVVLEGVDPCTLTLRPTLGGTVSQRLRDLLAVIRRRDGAGRLPRKLVEVGGQPELFTQEHALFLVAYFRFLLGEGPPPSGSELSSLPNASGSSSHSDDGSHAALLHAASRAEWTRPDQRGAARKDGHAAADEEGLRAHSKTDSIPTVGALGRTSPAMGPTGYRARHTQVVPPAQQIDTETGRLRPRDSRAAGVAEHDEEHGGGAHAGARSVASASSHSPAAEATHTQHAVKTKVCRPSGSPVAPSLPPPPLPPPITH